MVAPVLAKSDEELPKKPCFGCLQRFQVQLPSLLTEILCPLCLQQIPDHERTRYEAFQAQTDRRIRRWLLVWRVASYGGIPLFLTIWLYLAYLRDWADFSPFIPILGYFVSIVSIFLKREWLLEGALERYIKRLQKLYHLEFRPSGSGSGNRSRGGSKTG